MSRGATGTGRPAALPAGGYDPPHLMTAAQGLVVEFHGEDGRRKQFSVGALPLPAWHAALAAALSVRIGPEGSRRTLSSASMLWATVGRFMRFLAALPDAPQAPAQLTVDHIEAFRDHRSSTTVDRGVVQDLTDIASVLREGSFEHELAPQTRGYLQRRFPLSRAVPLPGYSDAEFARIVRAARADVAATRDRIEANRALLDRYRDDPGTLTVTEHALAEELATMMDTGIVPVPPGSAVVMLPERSALAGQAFLTLKDLIPLLVLLVAVTGRNVETIKELPVHHRIIENRAVELRVIKRRRGARNWHSTATWEIGPPGRELHTPGGLYLLLHRLSAPSRQFAGTTERVWGIWRHAVGPGSGGLATVGEHHDPFADGLSRANLRLNRWVARHGLALDPVEADKDRTEPDRDAEVTLEPLPLNFNRIRTSVEVRRVRQMGGHLPSAARTNSVPVLFASYLRGDATVTDWAHDIVAEALVDAEESALAAHRRTLEQAGHNLTVVSGPDTAHHLENAGLDRDTACLAAAGKLDTAWTECTDHDHHPATGRTCRSTFLDCFHCGNCLVTRKDLPRLLALLDAFAVRREQLAEADWWQRYGPAWAAIRRDILVKFTPAEIEHAAAIKPTDALLDLVEQPWQRP